MKTNRIRILKRSSQPQQQAVNWIYFLGIFICALLFTTTSQVLAQTDGIPRGAQLPYTRYESENAVRGGAAALQQALNYDQTQIASEASNQQYVSLPSNGSYVEWTATAAFQGVNLRFTMPDNASGTGNTGALAIFVNGTKVQNISLTSRWAYQYFHGSETEPVQEPGGKTFMRFDEVHFRLASSVNAGSTVRIAKDNGDGFTYGVDFLELEPVPAALGAPANSLSVTDYGANGADNVDDLAAFYSCLNAAKAAGKNVFVPAGRFLLSDRLDFNYSNMIFQGAGVWHTEIFFSTDLQFTGGFLARASNVNIGHFSLNTQNNDRFHYGETNPKYASVHGEPYKIYKGFMGTYGTGSRVHDVWVEHFECGFWIAGYDPPYPIDITTDLIITRARIRNNYADGVNFCQGTNNSVVEYSSIRNSGDDGLAMWPNNALSAPQERNNIFRYNTIENIWRAGGIAIFGGTGHQVFRNIIKDGVGGSAIRFTQDFPGYTFEQSMPKIVLTDNYIVSCGTSFDLWNQMRGAIEFYCPRGIYDLEFNNTQIINSQRHAINFEGNFNNFNFNNTTIDGTGMDAFVDNPGSGSYGGFGIRANASGNATFTTISYNRLESGEVMNHNPGFLLNIVPGIVNLTGITLTPTSTSVVEGSSATLTVAYTPANATNKGLTWTSSNTAVATVVAGGTGLGVVSAKAVGTAVITVVSAQGGFSRTCTVTVTPAVNISATDAAAGEGGNVGVFTISTSSISSNITVGYLRTGTATTGDFTPALSGTVTLTPAAPSATVTITPVDDALFEGSETVILTLQSGTGYTLGGNTTATVAIADNDNPPCTAPIIALTSSVPTIDQSIDAAWSIAPAMNINNATIGGRPADFNGNWKAMYNSTNLYILVQVSDATKFNDSGTSWWEDDVIEIFIDGDNSKGSSYDGINDFQLGFRYNDAAINFGGTSVTRSTGMQFAIQNVAGGYNLEAVIPWSTIGITPALGKAIGFEVAVDDDDNGGTRDTQMSAFATTTTAWSTPSVFGTVYLTTCGSTTPVTGVTVSPTSASVVVNATQQLTATVSPANATDKSVTWVSSNTAVATVNANGLVTAIGSGSTTITVRTNDGGFSATSAITVPIINIPVTGVTVSPASASILAGTTQTLTATVLPANATNKATTWTSSNTAVASVNASGLVTGLTVGSSVITVRTTDGGFTATSTITVTSAPIPVTGVTLTPATATLTTAGATQQLIATVAPANATNKSVTYATSNAAAATVSASGLVTAVANGSATITVTTVDQLRTATSVITVNISSTQTPYPSVAAAIPGIVEAENFDNGGEGIAYHDNETANNGGQYRTNYGVDIEVCGEGGYNVGWINAAEWVEYTVNVATTGTYAVEVRVAGTSASTFHIEMGGVDKTGILAVPNTGGWQTWQSVTKTGISLTAGTQVMRVYMDGGNFNMNRLTFTGSTVIPVTGVTVSPTTASKAVGTTQQLTATVSPSNATDKTVTWSSSNTAVATVNASGLVTCSAAGSSIITVRTNNGGFTATSTITVTTTTVPVTGVSVSPTTASKAVGTTQQLTATVLPSNATDKSVTWSSSNTAVATVNASGLVTCTAAGSSIITVRTNNGGFTATSTITVTGSSLTYYRIKNRWQNTYLTDGGDRVAYSTLPGTPGLNYEWIREDVGNGQFELKNASTGEYMHIENQTGSIQCTARTSGWASSRWSTEATDNGFVRIKNVWQPAQYIHVENLTGFAQHGTINAAWWSAQWIFEAVAKTASESISETLAEVSFMPNPVVDELNIEFNGNSFHSVQVFDYTGKAVLTQSIRTESTDLLLDMSELNKGLYIIRLVNDSKSEVIRIIKQ